nr:unnamed protein product [Spirometra erinaceieuropaei]
MYFPPNHLYHLPHTCATYDHWVPGERVAVGIIDPLPVSVRGSEFILMMVDYFTKHNGTSILRNLIDEVSLVTPRGESQSSFPSTSENKPHHALAGSAPTISLDPG